MYSRQLGEPKQLLKGVSLSQFIASDECLRRSFCTCCSERRWLNFETESPSRGVAALKVYVSMQNRVAVAKLGSYFLLKRQRTSVFRIQGSPRSPLDLLPSGAPHVEGPPLSPSSPHCSAGSCVSYHLPSPGVLSLLENLRPCTLIQKSCNSLHEPTALFPAKASAAWRKQKVQASDSFF